MQEEGEDNPLIPGVPEHFFFFFRQIFVTDSNSWVGFKGWVIRYRAGEGTMNPAVRVEDFLLVFQLGVTFNGITKELSQGLRDGKEAEDGKCELIVEFEGDVVNQTSLGFQHRLHTVEYREHSDASV